MATTVTKYSGGDKVKVMAKLYPGGDIYYEQYLDENLYTLVKSAFGLVPSDSSGGKVVLAGINNLRPTKGRIKDSTGKLHTTLCDIDKAKAEVGKSSKKFDVIPLSIRPPTDTDICFAVCIKMGEGTKEWYYTYFMSRDAYSAHNISALGIIKVSTLSATDKFKCFAGVNNYQPQRVSIKIGKATYSTFVAPDKLEEAIAAGYKLLSSGNSIVGNAESLDNVMA
jgi:hypothetical protein